MPQKSNLAAIRPRFDGWQRDVLDWIESADLDRLKFADAPQSFKSEHGTADEAGEATLAALIVALVLIKLGQVSSEDSMRLPTELAVIALGIGSAGEAIGLQPSGRREISEALEAAGVSLKRKPDGKRLVSQDNI